MRIYHAPNAEPAPVARRRRRSEHGRPRTPVTAVEAGAAPAAAADLMPLVIVLGAADRCWSAWSLVLLGLSCRCMRLTAQQHAALRRHRRAFQVRLDRRRAESGMPYWIWQALPRLFPEEFERPADYAAFGFLYETDDERPAARPADRHLAARGTAASSVVWFNCAVCHTGTWRDAEAATARTSSPACRRTISTSIASSASCSTPAADERLAPDQLIPAMQRRARDLGWLEQLVWRYYVIPRVREGLRAARARGCCRCSTSSRPGGRAGSTPSIPTSSSSSA